MGGHRYRGVPSVLTGRSDSTNSAWEPITPVLESMGVLILPTRLLYTPEMPDAHPNVRPIPPQRSRSEGAAEPPGA